MGYPINWRRNSVCKGSGSRKACWEVAKRWDAARTRDPRVVGWGVVVRMAADGSEEGGGDWGLPASTPVGGTADNVGAFGMKS